MSAAPWFKSRLASFDVETTGVDPLTARIVTATVVRVGGSEPTVEGRWVLQPEIDIPEAAAKIHGFTTERARLEGRCAADCLDEIRRDLTAAWAHGEPVVIFNAPYDLTVLRAELARHGLPDIEIGPVVDPLVLDKQLDRYRKGSRKLEAICNFRSVKHDGAHDSTADAVAAARLAYRLGSLYEEIGAFSPHDLHQLQIGWYAEQARGLAAYFAKQGKTETVNTEWPVRALCAAGGKAA
jgi:DNA polymerase-3 subunit epsilon